MSVVVFCGKLRVLTIVILSYSLNVRAATVHLYVSPTGSDSNDGRQASNPVKALSHVKDLLQTDGIRGNTVFVELMQGYHELTSTLHFDKAVTGSVVFRAYQGQEVHVVGGKRMPSNLFHHVTDQHVLQRLPQGSRDKVLEMDIAGLGVSDLGTMTIYGFEIITWTAPMEIFINGKSLRLAEWPNNNFINIRSTPDGQFGLRFTYNDSGSRDTAWAQETEPWTYGFWWWSYHDNGMPVTSVDPHTHTINLTRKVNGHGMRPGHYDPSGKHLPGYEEQGGYFRVINMLCELDQAGEYYIDRITKKLYVWPNTPHQTLTSSDVVYGSMVNQCIAIESNVNNIHFEDFSLEACRQFGVYLRNSTDVTFKNMEIKNTGSFGIYCSGDCRRVSILASDIHDVGGGISLQGGDFTTLSSSEIEIRDNHIWDHSRCGAENGDAIHMGGVHITVANNHLHHGQYTGIRYFGNDHVMEYNNVHHYCWNASDCGAIHSLRDWTFRGNIIRYNYIYHTLRGMPGAPVRGVMLDDEYSSALIEHNVFYNNEVHANIGGGRDNVIRNNIMYNSTAHSIQVDGRGLGTTLSHTTMLTRILERSPYLTPLWRTRYPELADTFNRHPAAPEGNQIYQNVFYNPPGIERTHYSSAGMERPDYFDVHDNYGAFKANDFWSPDDADFRLRCEAAQWASRNHFPQPVTLDQVGPRVPTGPQYLRGSGQQEAATRTTSSPLPCDTTTAAPATSVPRTAYLPDGSRPNTLYPDIPKTGCYFVIDHCPKHPEVEGTRADTIGTQNGTEEGCLSRAGPQWQWCGSPDNGTVVAVYGPTGAMTIGGNGCFFAEYGCRTEFAGIHRDAWGEQNENASVLEEACLSRAVRQWRYCGSNPDRPITSVFKPTGAFRTAGAGCWIKIPACPGNPSLEGFFYDAWGATNRNTDHDKEECLSRADYYWTKCGSYNNVPVTSFYRPDAAQRTAP